MKKTAIFLIERSFSKHSSISGFVGLSVELIETYSDRFVRIDVKRNNVFGFSLTKKLNFWLSKKTFLTDTTDVLIAELNILRYVILNFRVPVTLCYLYLESSYLTMGYLKRFKKDLKIIGFIHHTPSKLPAIIGLNKFNFIDTLFCLSEYQREKVISLKPFLTTAKMYHGVNTSKWVGLIGEKCMDLHKLYSKEFFIVIGNYLRDVERLSEMIDVLLEFTDLKVLIISNDALFSKHNGKLNDRVITNQNRLSEAQLKYIYEHALFCLNSFLDAVANNVLLECLVCGCPFLTTFNPSVMEYLGIELSNELQFDSNAELLLKVGQLRNWEYFQYIVGLQKIRASQLDWKLSMEQFRKELSL